MSVPKFNYHRSLLLGLDKALKRRKGVTKTFLRKPTPVDYSKIAAWEFKNGVILPKDFKLFYASGNGFLFEWIYTYNAKCDEVYADFVGRLQVNELENVVPIYGYETTTRTGIQFEGEKFIMKLSLESKVFEIAHIEDQGYIVLVYMHARYVPNICILTPDSSMSFLANSLAAYFRMAIAHLTIPHWQLAYSTVGLPQWSENMFRLIAPHLVPPNRKVNIYEGKPRRYDNCSEKVINILDPSFPDFSCPKKSPTTLQPALETRSFELSELLTLPKSPKLVKKKKTSRVKSRAANLSA